MGKVNWLVNQWVEYQLVPGLTQNVCAAAIYLAGEVKAEISQAGTLRYRSGSGKRPKTIYNFTHSVPGNPPFKQKSRLRASITWEVLTGGRPTGRVGTNVLYGLFLSKGTTKMAARPFLDATLQKRKAIIAAILLRQIKPGQLPAITANQFRPGVLGAGAARAGYLT